MTSLPGLPREEDPPGPGGHGVTLKGQLDLFAHSLTVILLNDLIDSLLERDTARVPERLQSLRAESPGHPALGAFATLCQVLQRWPVATPDVPGTARIVEWLDSEVSAAARVALGNSAEAFMRPVWRDLAITVAGRPYDPAHPHSHAAYLYLRGGDAPAALEALRTIEAHNLEPVPLQWTCVARYRVSGWHGCRVALFTLALTAPQYLADTVTALGDSALTADWERFWLDCAWLDSRTPAAAAWFPAWYLIEHPATRLEEQTITSGDTDSPAANAFQSMRQLMALEPSRQGPLLIAARRVLQRIDARLFGLYMSRLAAR